MPHISVPVYKGMAFEDLKSALKQELSWGAICGNIEEIDSEAEDYEPSDACYNAMLASVDALELKEGADSDDVFPDLEPLPDDGDSEYYGDDVYAYFVFMPIED